MIVSKVILVYSLMFSFSPCRMTLRLHKTPCVLLRSQTQMILSLRYGKAKKMTPLMSFKGFESNLLTNPDSLFHCAVCNVFLLFGPSTRLMSIGWRMSLSWVTVMATVPCTFLHTTTLMRSSWSLTISWPLGVHIGKMQMKSSMPCFEMTPTLPTLLAKCSLCGRGTIVCQHGGGMLTSITRRQGLAYFS